MNGQRTSWCARPVVFFKSPHHPAHDRQIDLTDIARDLNLKLEDVLDEIENIDAAGTKVNLDYVINKTLDEESLEELFDFLKSEDEGSKELIAEWNDVYGEEELRMARIKFLSEYAN